MQIDLLPLALLLPQLWFDMNSLVTPMLGRTLTELCRWLGGHETPGDCSLRKGNIYMLMMSPPPLSCCIFFSRATSSQEESKVGKDLSFTWCLGGRGEQGTPAEGRFAAWIHLNICILECMQEPGAQAHLIKFWRYVWYKWYWGLSFNYVEMCEQDAKALRIKTKQFGFPAPMLTTPLNGRVSELFQLDTNAIVSFGGGRERKGSTCLLAGFSTGVRRQPFTWLPSLSELPYTLSGELFTKPVNSENCYACICPCSGGTMFTVQYWD